MSLVAGVGRLRRLVLMGASTATVMALAPPPVHAAEESATGFYVAASLAGASHRDIAVLDWRDRPKTYLDVDLGLRVGAAWNGVVGALALEHGAMIGGPGASYVALFGGYAAHVSRRLILELAGEFGLHLFHDVGTIVGTYDVVRENGARLPFWGVRLTASLPLVRWRWQPAFFVAVRTDVGEETVSSELRMTCPSFGFPDGPECHEGASASASSSVGGTTFLTGFELRRIVQIVADGSPATPREAPAP